MELFVLTSKLKSGITKKYKTMAVAYSSLVSFSLNPTQDKDVLVFSNEFTPNFQMLSNWK